VTEQSVRCADFRSSHFCRDKHSVHGGGWNGVIKNFNVSAELHEIIQANVGVVITRNKVYKNIFQFREVLLRQICTPFEVVWISHKLCCFPIPEICFKGLRQNYRAVFYPCLENTHVFVEHRLVCSLNPLWHLENRLTFPAYSGYKVNWFLLKASFFNSFARLYEISVNVKLRVSVLGERLGISMDVEVPFN